MRFDDEIDRSVDWKAVCERVWKGFFGDDCQFEIVHEDVAPLYSPAQRIFVVRIAYDGDGPFRPGGIGWSTETSRGVPDVADIDLCYRDLLRMLTGGRFSKGGVSFPALDFESDEEMLLKLTAGGFL